MAISQQVLLPAQASLQHIIIFAMGLSHQQVFLQSSPSPLKLPEADIEQSSLENNLKRQRKVSQMMGYHHLPDDVCPK